MPFVPVACHGAPVKCPVHGSTHMIASRPGDCTVDGEQVCVIGDAAACGCVIDSGCAADSFLMDQPLCVVGSSSSASGAVIVGGSPGMVINMDTLAAHGRTTPAPTLAQSARPSSKPKPANAPSPALTDVFGNALSAGITLRIGVFFDGTGNNLKNAQAGQACWGEALGYSGDEAELIAEHCRRLGFDDQGGMPDSSYANGKSNVARLYELYSNTHPNDFLSSGEPKDISFSVYIDGVGTTSDAEDSLYGQALGRGETGVERRVAQVPNSIIQSTKPLTALNFPIRKVEFDIFGFSRGAAAARHFANRLYREGWAFIGAGFPENWNRQIPLSINFIGLFDTVASILPKANQDGYLSDAGTLQLGLPFGIARDIAHLVARDERRDNFDLTSAGWRDIVLPGVHSDLGGGYLPVHRERLSLHRPCVSIEPRDRPVAQSRAFVERLERRRLEGDYWNLHGFSVFEEHWTGPVPVGMDPALHKVYAVTYGEREVHDGLARIYLNIMYALALRASAPIGGIGQFPEHHIPDELTVIGEKLLAYVLGNAAQINLTDSEQALLYRRYIHFSSHWNPARGLRNATRDILFINRPAPTGRRVHSSD